MLKESDTVKELTLRESNHLAVGSYVQHFGFSKLPFSSLPRSSYFYQYDSALHVLNTVIFSIKSGEAVVKVTGDPGVGKTYLLRQAMSSLAEECYVINNLNPNVSANVFLKSIVEEFGVAYSLEANNAQLIKHIQYLLYEHYTKTDYRIVVWVDDAHNLPQQTLEVIQTLAQLETSARKLIQFVLSGTTALDDKLKSRRLVHLKQKIIYAERLLPLDYAAFKGYVNARLTDAGSPDGSYFTDAAMQALFKQSFGIPRQINCIAHKAMLLAFGKGHLEIKKEDVVIAAQDQTLQQKKHDPLLFFIVYLPLMLAIAGLVTVILMEWISS